MRQELYVRALQRAAEIYGGIDPLAERLKIPAEDLRRFVAGEERIPLEVFLNAVDLLLEDEVASMRGASQPEAKPKRDSLP